MSTPTIKDSVISGAERFLDIASQLTDALEQLKKTETDEELEVAIDRIEEITHDAHGVYFRTLKRRAPYSDLELSAQDALDAGREAGVELCEKPYLY